MRLIDADTLLNKICKEFDIPKDWDGDIAEPLQTIIDIIDNQPTAYDVEEVLGQIKYKLFCRDLPTNIVDHIVRRGGVE